MSNDIFDLKKLKSAWDKGEGSMLMNWFADDFEQTEIDEDKRTKAEYAKMVEGGLSSGVKMEIYNLVPGQQMAAYSFTCHMPNGGIMVGNSILEIQGGKIVKETTVQARDK